MPRLLQINVCCNWGSTGHIAEECNKAAAAIGFECSTVYGRCANPSVFESYRFGKKLSVYEHYAESVLLDNEGLASRASTKRLVKFIQDWNPDIVHLHNIHDHFLNYKILFDYLNETEIKVVWTFHDFWPVTGHCMHFVKSGCDKWKTGCRDCPQKGLYPKSLVDRSSRNWELKKRLFTDNRNLRIVSVSQWVGDVVKLSFLGDKSIQVINNGIDLDVFRPTVGDMSKYGIRSTDFVILSVASQWSIDKGLEDFIQMSKMLQSDEIIVLVGVSKAIKDTLPRNIIGVERTDSIEELTSLYTRADVVCIMSPAETFGLSIVEGYACGTPGVVYDNTAPPALITDKTGFVAPDKDYRAVYSAIQKIKTAGKDSYSKACISLAGEKYSKAGCFDQYVNIYKSLL